MIFLFFVILTIFSFVILSEAKNLNTFTRMHPLALFRSFTNVQDDNHPRNPSLELSGLFTLRSSDERLHPPFRHKGDVVLSAQGVEGAQNGEFLFRHISVDGTVGVLKPQCQGYILGAEQRLSLWVTEGADGTEFVTLENLNSVHTFLILK